MWQDWAIAGSNVLFVYGLLPMTFGSIRPVRMASVPTVLGLAIIAGATATLGLSVATAVTTLEALMWLVVAVRGPSAPAPDHSRQP